MHYDQRVIAFLGCPKGRNKILVKKFKKFSFFRTLLLRKFFKYFIVVINRAHLYAYFFWCKNE